MQQIRVKTDSLLNIPIMNTEPMEIIDNTRYKNNTVEYY